MKIETREALIARREQAKAWLAAEQRVILVCAGTGCIAGGAMKVYDKLQELCLERKLKTRVALREEGGKDTLHFKRSGCQGFCEMGPLIEIQPEGIFYTHVHPEDCEEILKRPSSTAKSSSAFCTSSQTPPTSSTTISPSIKSRNASFSRPAATPTRKTWTNIWHTTAMRPWKKRSLT